MTNSIIIFPVPALKDNYIWVMNNPEKKTALIVDPGEATPVLHFLRQEKLKLVGILITHHHWDHTQGIEELKIHYPVPVYGPAENIDGKTHSLKEPEKISIKDFPDFAVLDIPGHTRGHIAYYGSQILFCGDTLFAAGCGRIFEGTPLQMYASLQKINALPHDTKIYCAHEYTLNNLRFAQTIEPNNNKIAERIKKVSEIRKLNKPSLPATLLEEKETNPFLRCDSEEIIANIKKRFGNKINSELDVFICLRKLKDDFG